MGLPVFSQRNLISPTSPPPEPKPDPTAHSRSTIRRRPATRDSSTRTHRHTRLPTPLSHTDGAAAANITPALRRSSSSSQRQRQQTSAAPPPRRSTGALPPPLPAGAWLDGFSSFLDEPSDYGSILLDLPPLRRMGNRSILDATPPPPLRAAAAPTHPPPLHAGVDGLGDRQRSWSPEVEALWEEGGRVNTRGRSASELAAIHRHLEECEAEERALPSNLESDPHRPTSLSESAAFHVNNPLRMNATRVDTGLVEDTAAVVPSSIPVLEPESSSSVPPTTTTTTTATTTTSAAPQRIPRYYHRLLEASSTSNSTTTTTSSGGPQTVSTGHMTNPISPSYSLILDDMARAWTTFAGEYRRGAHTRESASIALAEIGTLFEGFLEEQDDL